MNKRENFIAVLGIAVILFYSVGYYIGFMSNRAIIDETYSVSQGSFSGITFSAEPEITYQFEIEVSNNLSIDILEDFFIFSL